MSEVDRPTRGMADPSERDAKGYSDAVPAAFRGNERFRVIRWLGEGGFGAVYEAEDGRYGNRVALKLLRRRSAAVYERFKREFRTMAEVSHPNLVQLYGLHDDGPHRFFTMELVVGRTLTAALSSAPSLIRDAFGQLAAGLSALHAARIVHRDVKPDNVLVSDAGQLKILDFGLARPVELDTSGLTGTSVYMAPELFRGQSAGPPADIYALGTMLYQVLVGAFPFGQDANRAVRSKVRGAQADMPVAVATAHPELAELCQLALSADPADRPGADEILRLLGVARVERGSSRVRMPPSHAMVERELPLARLSAALEGSAGTAVAVKVTGQAGSGKTALCRRFLADQQAAGETVVLSGRCLETDHSPYKALDEVLNGLVAFLAGATWTEQARVVPHHLEALLRVFPAFERVDEFSSISSTARIPRDAWHLRRRAFEALADSFRRLCSFRRVIIHLDDLQWFDRDGADLLRALTGPDDAPPIFWLLSERVQGVAPDSDATDMGDGLGSRIVDHLRLAHLSGAGVRALLAQDPNLSSLAEPHVLAVERESGGSPFLVRAIARRWAELDSSKAPPSLGELWADWGAAFDPEVRRLHETLCVAGKPVPLQVAVAASGAQPGAVATLRSAGLVANAVPSVAVTDAAPPVEDLRSASDVASPPAEELTPVYERLRDAIVSQLSDTERRARHEALATAFAAWSDPHGEGLVDQLVGAGHTRAAAVHALLGARHAERSFSFARAASLYARVIALGDRPIFARLRLVRRYARALSGAGEDGVAGRLLLGAAEDARAAAAHPAHVTKLAALAVDLERAGAEHLLRSGAFSDGLAVLEETLQSLGAGMPTTLEEAFVQGAPLMEELQRRGVEPAEPTHPVPTRLQQRASLLQTVCTSMTHVDLRVLPLVYRLLLDELELGEGERLQRSSALFALATSAIDQSGLAKQALLLSRRLLNGHDDPLGSALLRLAEAEQAHFGGDFGGALASLDEAERLLVERCRGAHRLLGQARMSSVVIQYSHRGDFRTRATVIERWLREADARRDYFQANWLRAVMALLWVARDEPETARAQLTRARENWSEGDVGMFDTAATLYHDVVDRYQGASVDWRAQSGAERAVRSSPVGHTLLLRGYYHLHRAWAALRHQAQAASGHEHQDQAAALAAVREELQGLRDLAFPLWTGIADACEANQHWLDGDRDRAIAMMGGAEAQLRDIDVLALAACARRRTGEFLRGAAGAELIRGADQELLDLGVVLPEAFARAYFSPFVTVARA